MQPLKPRYTLKTHIVENQPPIAGDFDLMSDPAILDNLPHDFDEHKAHLSEFGKWAGSYNARELGHLANENPPKLKIFDARGRRIDEIEFHPSYHELMKNGLEAGVSARAWKSKANGHSAHAVLVNMLCWADTGVCCPQTMTYAVAPVLQQEKWTHDLWLNGVLASKYDDNCRPAREKSGLTMGMAMTEKQGGSDLRTNSTKAKVGANGEAELIGHKWFCSAPMSDAFLTLAYEKQISGKSGLSCFLVPKWRPDGTRNAIEIQRLKDKMGDRSNASSEIEYRDAWAKRIGEPGRGIATIIKMAHHTRLDTIAASASGMRKAVSMATHFTRYRTAFQKKLIDQPLMRATLSDLALESEAAIALSMLVAHGFDAPKNSAENLLSRLLTPIAKYWVCKRQPSLVAEAMECIGGVGFVEESGMPLLFRTSPLNAIWEGSGNVIVLDIARALQNKDIAEIFQNEMAGIGRKNTKITPLTDWLTKQNNVASRLFAERAALVFCYKALPDYLKQIWFDKRIKNPSHIWGAEMGIDDSNLLLSRLENWHLGV